MDNKSMDFYKLFVVSQKQPREYYSGKVLLGKARLAMVYVTKVTCRIKDI
jgi:hypothetical protein